MRLAHYFALPRSNGGTISSALRAVAAVAPHDREIDLKHSNYESLSDDAHPGVLMVYDRYG